MSAPAVDAAVAILAGGEARRMGGRAKSFLRVGGERIIDRQLAVLRPLFEEILVVTNEPDRYADLGARVLTDLPELGAGPLRAIATAVEGSTRPHVVCIACDLPYLDARALLLVRDTAPEAAAVVPIVGERAEPLHARYAKRAGPTIRTLLGEGTRKAAALMDRVTTHRIDEAALRSIDAELKFLTNVNTLSQVD